MAEPPTITILPEMKNKRAKAEAFQDEKGRISSAIKDGNAQIFTALELRSRELSECVKELNCHYGISNLPIII
jgi:hypothetical protein